MCLPHFKSALGVDERKKNVPLYISGCSGGVFKAVTAELLFLPPDQSMQVAAGLK